MTPLMQIEKLSKSYLLPTGKILKAVEDVSFTLFKGETFGLVGESGCGKTTLVRCLLRLEKADSGKVFFDGKEISDLTGRELFQFRRETQMIFQNISGSLNPKMTIGESIAEPLHIHQIVPKEGVFKEVCRLLDSVGLSSSTYRKYPYEFSGGQKQRVAIARALSLRPRLLICDEPVSALDVSIQAQIINLLKDLQKEYHLTYFFIAHEEALVRYMSDRVAIMHQGQLVKLS